MRLRAASHPPGLLHVDGFQHCARTIGCTRQRVHAPAAQQQAFGQTAIRIQTQRHALSRAGFGDEMQTRIARQLSIAVGSRLKHLRIRRVHLDAAQAQLDLRRWRTRTPALSRLPPQHRATLFAGLRRQQRFDIGNWQPQLGGLGERAGRNQACKQADQTGTKVAMVHGSQTGGAAQRLRTARSLATIGHTDRDLRQQPVLVAEALKPACLALMLHAGRQRFRQLLGNTSLGTSVRFSPIALMPGTGSS